MNDCFLRLFVGCIWAIARDCCWAQLLGFRSALIKTMKKAPQSQTNWKRLREMKDEDIDFSENPEWTPEMFAGAVVRRGLKPAPAKAQLTLRLDSDVLDWFKRQGRGYQTRINALLRAYMEANKSEAASRRS